MWSDAESKYIDAVVKHAECKDEVGIARFMNTIPVDGPDSAISLYNKSKLTIKYDDWQLGYFVAAVLRRLKKSATNPFNSIYIPTLPIEPLGTKFTKECFQRYIERHLNKALKRAGLRAELKLHDLREELPVEEPEYRVSDKQFNRLFKVKNSR